MASLELNFRLPAAYAEAIEATAHALHEGTGSLTIEYASLRGRYEALFAALAVAHVYNAEGPVNVGLLAPDMRLARFFLSDWFERAKHPLRRRFGSGPVKCAELAEGKQLWLLEPKDAETFPRGSLDGLVVVHAHLLEKTDVRFFRDMNQGALVAAGQLADRDHWFYAMSRDAAGERPGVRLPAKLVCRAFPDQKRALAAEAKRLDRTSYARDMLLEDVVNLGGVVFSRFARERLWLRSDKDKRYLTAAQAATAQRQEGTPLVPFEVSPIQKRYLAIKRKARNEGKPARFLLLKYRRGGFTSLEQGESYKLCTTKPRTAAVTLAHTLEATSRIFTMVKTFHDEDPYAPDLKGVGNARRLEFAKNKSVFFIGTAGASGFARGDTLQRVHGSEVAFWLQGPNQFPDVSNLVAGLTEAASNGEVVLESTPNGVEWFATTYKDAKAGLNNFTPIFIPWFADAANVALAGTYNAKEIMETLSDREKELMTMFGLRVDQIAFRRAKLKENRMLFVQEYPEDDITCFLVSGTPYFDPELVQKRLAQLKRKPKPTKKTIPGGFLYTARPYEEKDESRRFVIGADTSEGIPGCDPNGYGVLDWKTGEQREWVHGMFKPSELAKLCHAASKRWNNALVGIERNNHGHAVLQKMNDLGGPQGRSHLIGGKLFHYLGDRAGWDTNPTSRPVLLSNLAEALESREEGWNDEGFLEELTTFRKQSDGKWGADANCHDDKIFYWGVAEQMRLVPVHSTSSSSF
jgi:hypothetical protein